MDDRPQPPLLDLSFTDREPAATPLGEPQALAGPADEVIRLDEPADELDAYEDYDHGFRSERSADIDDYAPGYDDDLDLDPARFILPGADLEL